MSGTVPNEPAVHNAANQELHTLKLLAAAAAAAANPECAANRKTVPLRV